MKFVREKTLKLILFLEARSLCMNCMNDFVISLLNWF